MNDGCRVNSHLRNLPTSILGKRSKSWYLEHKLNTCNEVDMVQLLERVWYSVPAAEVKCSIHGRCTYFLYYIIIITITVTQSIGCPSDFRWLCPLEFRWCLMVISSGLAADLLSVHRKSVGSPSEKSVGLTSPTRNARTSSGNSAENYSTCITEKIPF
jgi:hypothetical protein